MSGVALKITLLLMMITIIYLLHQSSYNPTNLYHISYSFSSRENSNGVLSSSPYHNNAAKKQNASSSFPQFTAENTPTSAKKEKNKLEKLLRKAVMKDKKTVIITTLNEAWAKPNSTFDLFLESFGIGNETQKLLKHVIVCTMDNKAYSRCLQENLHCYTLFTDQANFSGEAFIMSETYNNMIWARIHFLHTVLQMGYDFIFTDADVMWFRDPFQILKPEGDIQISSDQFYSELSSYPNGGFKYVQSNNRTIQFYKYWYKGKDYFPYYNDQQVLNVIRYGSLIQKIGLSLRYLKTVYFGGFCEPSKDLNSVITMHANCCIGLKNKVTQMRSVIKDWKKYMSLPIDAQKSLNTTSCPWSLPIRCAY